MAFGHFIPRILKPGHQPYLIGRPAFLTGKVHVYWLPLQLQQDAADPVYVLPTSSLYPATGTILRHAKVIRLISERATNAAEGGGDFYANCSVDVSNDPFDPDTFSHYDGVAYSDPVSGQTVYAGFMTFPIASGVPATDINEVAALLVNGPGIEDAIAAQIAAIADAHTTPYYGTPPFSVNQSFSFVAGGGGSAWQV